MGAALRMIACRVCSPLRIFVRWAKEICDRTVAYCILPLFRCDRTVSGRNERIFSGEPLCSIPPKCASTIAPWNLLSRSSRREHREAAPFRYEPQSIPQFAGEMEKAGFSPRFVQHVASVAQDCQDNSRRIRVAKPREVHCLIVQRKEDLPWVGSRTRPLS